MTPKVAFELYQVAGLLLISPDTNGLSDGQRERLSALLLDVLSELGRYRARVVRDLRRLAVKP